MEFEEWRPFYEDIVRQFGFSKEEDELSAQTLAEICRHKWRCDKACLQKAIKRKVTVCGFGPNLESDLERAEIQGTVIAADGATGTLMTWGICPDIMVTDLDGSFSAQLSASEKGSIAVILAHGDNIQTIRREVPLFMGPITPTCQGRPFDQVENFGGFTDGDRAVLLARHFGAKDILLVGFDFRKPRLQAKKDSEVKKKKLDWARRLIFDLNPPNVTLSSP